LLYSRPENLSIKFIAILILLCLTENHKMFRFIMKSKKNVFSIISIQKKCCKVFLLQGVTCMTRTIDDFDSFSTKMGRWNLTIVSKYFLLSSVRKSTSENIGNLLLSRISYLFRLKKSNNDFYKNVYYKVTHFGALKC